MSNLQVSYISGQRMPAPSLLYNIVSNVMALIDALVKYLYLKHMVAA